MTTFSRQTSCSKNLEIDFLLWMDSGQHSCSRNHYFLFAGNGQNLLCLDNSVAHSVNAHFELLLKHLLCLFLIRSGRYCTHTRETRHFTPVIVDAAQSLSATVVL